MAFKIDVVYYPASKKTAEAKKLQNDLNKVVVEKKAKIILSDVFKGRPEIGPGGRVIVEAEKLGIVRDLFSMITKVKPKDFGVCNINIQAR